MRQRDLYRGQNTERWIQMPVPSLVDRYYPPCLFFSKQKKQQQRKRKKLYNAFPFVFPKAFVFDHKRCINVSYISTDRKEATMRTNIPSYIFMNVTIALQKNGHAMMEKLAFLAILHHLKCSLIL